MKMRKASKINTANTYYFDNANKRIFHCADFARPSHLHPRGSQPQIFFTFSFCSWKVGGLARGSDVDV